MTNRHDSPVNLLLPLYSANTTAETAITAARRNARTTMTNPALLRHRYAFVPRIPVTYDRAGKEDEKSEARREAIPAKWKT